MVKSSWKGPQSIGEGPKSGDVRGSLCDFCEICGLDPWMCPCDGQLMVADRTRTVLVTVADKLIILGVAVNDNPSKELWRTCRGNRAVC
jgi:hypothetical protein